MFDFPREIVAEPIGQFELIERIVIKDELAVGDPWPRQLQFVKNAEFQDRKSTRLNSSHSGESRMPSSA